MLNIHSSRIMSQNRAKKVAKSLCSVWTRVYSLLLARCNVCDCSPGAMARRASDGGSNILQFVQWYHGGDALAYQQQPSPLLSQPSSLTHNVSAHSSPYLADGAGMPLPQGYMSSLSASMQSTAGTSPDEDDDDDDDDEAIKR